MTAHESLPGRVAGPADLQDGPSDPWPVNDREIHYDTAYMQVSFETIVAPDGSEHGRAIARPNDAVGVLALDDQDRVLLVAQYRHAIGRRLFELPAGMLDVAGEAALDAAARELAEEADVVAEHWSETLALLPTPGYSTESWQVFRATGLSVVPSDDRHEREGEEADMQQWWAPFPDVVDAALDGRIRDCMTVSAVLAEQVRRSRS